MSTLFPSFFALSAFAYPALSAVTFLAYVSDKRAARRGGRRTPETRLHLLSLAGGWPGALLAQQVARHKTAKASFQFVFWWTVVLNIAAFVALISLASR